MSEESPSTALLDAVIVAAVSFSDTYCFYFDLFNLFLFFLKFF